MDSKQYKQCAEDRPSQGCPTSPGASSLYGYDQAKDTDGFTFQIVIDLRNRQSRLQTQQRETEHKLTVIRELLALFE